MKRKVMGVVIGIVLVCAGYAQAAQFTYVRIGDIDGIGFGDGSGKGPDALAYQKASGGPINVGAAGTLEAGDFLPDLNKSGFTQTHLAPSEVSFDYGDDFDNRSSEGVMGDGDGFVNNNAAGASGESFTDISLSTSYDQSQTNSEVWNDTATAHGAGGTFPSSPDSALPNQPGFVFDFNVDYSAIVGTPALFFNMVFADYDINPAVIDFERLDTTTFTLNVATQPAADDGLIQGKFAVLNFADVFTDTGSDWRGYLKVNFNAPNEPFTAFDYVEVATAPLPSNVPEPASLFLLGTGLVGFAGYRRRRRKAS